MQEWEQEGRSAEINRLRALNDNLTSQLKDANKLLGRPADCFDKQNNVGFIYNKLEDRLGELLQSMQECLDNLEIASAKSTK